MEQVTIEELVSIAEMTIELTRLRQNECKHLCIENVAPEIFGSLLGELAMHKSGKIRMGATDAQT